MGLRELHKPQVVRGRDEAKKRSDATKKSNDDLRARMEKLGIVPVGPVGPEGPVGPAGSGGNSNSYFPSGW